MRCSHKGIPYPLSPYNGALHSLKVSPCDWLGDFLEWDGTQDAADGEGNHPKLDRIQLLYTSLLYHRSLVHNALRPARKCKYCSMNIYFLTYQSISSALLLAKSLCKENTDQKHTRYKYEWHKHTVNTTGKIQVSQTLIRRNWFIVLWISYGQTSLSLQTRSVKIQYANIINTCRGMWLIVHESGECPNLRS